MQYRSPKGYTGFSQFMILIGFGLVGLVIAGLTQTAIGLMLAPNAMTTGNGIQQIIDVLMDPKNVNYLRISQFVGTLFIMFVPAALYSLITNGKEPFWLGFNKYLNWKQIVLAFVLIYLANVVAQPLAEFSKWAAAQLPGLEDTAKRMEDAYNENVKAMSNLTGWGEYLMAIIIMAFLPAVFEEMAFRGALQNIFTKWWGRPLLAIIVASVIFSLIHASIYLFLSRIVLGLVLGLLFFKSKNIWVNIVAHFLNNFLAVTQMFYASRFLKKEVIDPNEMDFKVEWWMALIALAAMVFLFKLFDKYSEEHKARIDAKEKVMLAAADPFKGIANASQN